MFKRREVLEMIHFFEYRLQNVGFLHLAFKIFLFLLSDRSTKNAAIQHILLHRSFDNFFSFLLYMNSLNVPDNFVIKLKDCN
jgi:hypothetical protein